ncbi:XRE family transcriptional regulator [Nonomuraea sp. NN258]|uniref:XRE family transcriptional regulator n=1 Tax=Nonomuraea antri TaxID=2730852 RepID=UPI0015681571|nr:XRE family transcriptional regulator [Nonomuraea antri]NRQ32120.1 XRE family transcriptional regulator [Nonomuraea antri]
MELGFGTDYTPVDVTVLSHSVEPEGTITREWELIMSAANESSDHAARAEAASVGPYAMEQIAEDIVRLARSYVHAPPLPLFDELTRVRDRAYWMLDQTSRPDQRRDLYLLAGQACGLLASASFDLGYPAAASEQARAARAYGDVTGHAELRAWADGMLACIEFWAGHPSRALSLVERGLDDAPTGTPRIRLLSIGARAAALQGDAAYVNKALQTARQVDGGAHEMHDEIGGEFGFDEARHAFCSGSAYVTLGRSSEAIDECRRALELYRSVPVQQRWYAAEASASVDLSIAYLLAGDTSGAAEALSPVFGLPMEKRVEGLVKRITQVRAVLATVGGHEASELAERIEHFSADSITRILPADS